MDPDIEALREFIGPSVERRTMVADAIGANEQTLYQILRGIPLKSGKPRGIGRHLREALDQHFPEWRGSLPKAREPAVLYSARSRQPELAESLEVVLTHLAALTAGKWAMVRARLDSAIGNPDDIRAAVEDISALLAAGPNLNATNRTGTGG